MVNIPTVWAGRHNLGMVCIQKIYSTYHLAYHWYWQQTTNNKPIDPSLCQIYSSLIRCFSQLSLFHSCNQSFIPPKSQLQQMKWKTEWKNLVGFCCDEVAITCSGFGMGTVGNHPNDLNPNKIPTGGVVQNCRFIKLRCKFFEHFFTTFFPLNMIPWYPKQILLHCEEAEKFIFDMPQKTFSMPISCCQSPPEYIKSTT